VASIYEGSKLKRATISRISNQTVLGVREKAWCGGLFSPLTPGSMRGSIIALMKYAIGAGVLSLPYVNK